MQPCGCHSLVTQYLQACAGHRAAQASPAARLAGVAEGGGCARSHVALHHRVPHDRRGQPPARSVQGGHRGRVGPHLCQRGRHGRPQPAGEPLLHGIDCGRLPRAAPQAGSRGSHAGRQTACCRAGTQSSSGWQLHPAGSWARGQARPTPSPAQLPWPSAPLPAACVAAAKAAAQVAPSSQEPWPHAVPLCASTQRLMARWRADPARARGLPCQGHAVGPPL